MKKSLKKLPALLVLVLLLTLATSLSAYGDGTGSITINKPEHISLEGQVYKAYKIFNVTNVGDHYSYTLVPAYNDFINYPTYGSETLQQYIEKLVSHSDKLNELATNLWKYIAAKPSIIPENSATGGSGASVKIDNLSHGYYLVYGSGLADGNQVVVAACALNTAGPNFTVTLKADVPTIEKQVYNQHESIKDWDNWADANIGDTVDYKLTSAVPKLTGYTSYKYIVHDTMSAGITFNPSSVVVKIKGVAVSTPQNYTVVVNPSDGHTFDIRFNENLLLSYDEGDKIEIFYSGTLNSSAVINLAGNPNQVVLEYSNNPYDESVTGKTPPDEVIVYTGRLIIFKHMLNDQEEKVGLANAKFELYREGSDEKVKFIEISAGSAANPAIYRVATAAEIAAPHGKLTTILVSPESGLIHLEGLGASYGADDFGLYYVKEIQAPDGFNSLENNVDILFYFDYENSVWKMGDPDNALGDKIAILNQSGTKFPETGGIGRKIFYTLGSLLMVGAFAALLIRRKIKQQAEWKFIA
ncbi:MAG: SpaH/EbpB family LPXTG-anchored major pilin [Clostridiales bacterium]|nr:SpaH/EbpB family LPXTG-anchored major pilin [Clostridiales bacterium]